MDLLDLDILKRHLRIFHDDEDTEVELYGSAAEGIVLQYLDRPVYPAGVEIPLVAEIAYDEFAIHVNSEIKAAMLLVAGDLYANREPDPDNKGEAALQPVVRRLLAPYRVWRFVPDEELLCGYVL